MAEVQGLLHYKESKDLGMQLVAYRSFCRYWLQQLGYIVTSKPRSDLQPVPTKYKALKNRLLSLQTLCLAIIFNTNIVTLYKNYQCS